MWKNEDPSNLFPDVLDKIEIIIPTEGLMFDYCYQFKQKGLWKQWQDSLKGEKLVEGSSLIIPTIDTLRYKYILNMHLKVCFFSMLTQKRQKFLFITKWIHNIFYIHQRRGSAI